jgi:K+ transporter
MTGRGDANGGAPVTSTPAATAGHVGTLPTAATVGALGVVYGDIGTSPLYALKEAAQAASHGEPLTHAAILGVVSLILWSLILIIIDLADITDYIGRETIIPREDIPGMWVWRELLFAFLQRNAECSAARHRDRDPAVSAMIKRLSLH